MPPTRPLPNHIVAIDATNRVHTLWHTCYNREITLTTWLDELRWLRDKIPHTRFITCWDQGTSFRKSLDSTYKSHRSARPPQKDLGETLGAARKPHNLPLGIEALGSESYEADDILASLAHQAYLNDHPITLISPDKDLISCLRYPQVKLISGYSRSQIVHHSCQLKHRDRDSVWDQYRVRVQDWEDYQCLVGDAGDNIQGWVGVGPKTASQLLEAVSDSLNTDCPMGFEDLFSSRPSSQKIRDENRLTYTPRIEAERIKFEARYPVVRQLVGLVHGMFV